MADFVVFPGLRRFTVRTTISFRPRGRNRAVDALLGRRTNARVRESTMPRTEQSRRHGPPIATIGDFAVERRLDVQPGVSALYAVGEVDVDETVMLQLLRFLAGRPAAHQALEQAVELREQLACDGLVPVIATGHVFEGSWIAFDAPDALTLREVLALEGPLSLPRSVAILRPVATALDAGRAHGLVCDALTADTVLVSGSAGLDETGRLIELGPAWPADIRPGRLLGDPSVLAPEVIRGEPPGSAANIYALTALLVHCLTGAPLFSAPTRGRVLSAHLSSPPPRLSDRAGTSEALDALIAIGLAKDPSERPASAGELIDRAAQAVGEESGDSLAVGWVAVQAPIVPAPAASEPPALVTATENPAPTPSGSGGWEPPAKVTRSLRSIAVAVPALALTVLAVIAAMHSEPVTVASTPSAAGRARDRSTPPRSVARTTTGLTPVQAFKGRPAPTGHLEISSAGFRRLLTVAAEHLPPERRHPRQAYAVWLSNSRRDSALLGFVVPRVGAGGRFESHRDLPANAGRYRRVVVTLESGTESAPKGPVILRGELPALTATGSSGP
jgi:serine/threonine-protein kinase